MTNNQKKITQINARKVRGKIQVIVLAAGQGKRMGDKNLPKVLIPFKGVPIIKHLLAAVKNSGVCAKPVIVIGQQAEAVKKELGPDYIYIYQAQQLGTGHAVMSAQKELAGKVQNIMVLYGDHPLVTSTMIKKLTDVHLQQGKVLTMATVSLPDFEGWRQVFFDFGRVIRDKNGRVIRIVEKKDATKKQLEIKEGNPSYFCFKADWLWANLAKLKNDNTQNEYYLTDLAKLACDQKQEVATVEIEPKEALGINTAKQLKLLEQFGG